MPTTGTKFFQYESDWEKLYSEDLTDDEKEKIQVRDPDESQRVIETIVACMGALRHG